MKSKKRKKEDLETKLAEQAEEFAGLEENESALQRMKEAVEAQESLDRESQPIEIVDNTPDVDELERQIREDLALQLQQGNTEDDLEASDVPSIDLSQLDEQEIQSCVEALIFLADKPLSLKKMKSMLIAEGSETTKDAVENAIEQIRTRYHGSEHGIELMEIAGGYQFRTKPIRASLAQKLAKVQTQRLSRGAMESLAIIAYRQPVMKEQIDQIRGVDSSYFLRTLLEKKLIEISGRSELPGRPLLYNTTSDFLEIFALKDLQSLPPLQEIEQMVPHLSNDSEDPQVQQIRQMVHQMNETKEKLQYDPREDDRLLKEIRERVKQIPSSTPYLEEQKRQEALLVEQQEQESENILLPPETSPPLPDPEANTGNS